MVETLYNSKYVNHPNTKKCWSLRSLVHRLTSRQDTEKQLQKNLLKIHLFYLFIENMVKNAPQSNIALNKSWFKKRKGID